MILSDWEAFFSNREVEKIEEMADQYDVPPEIYIMMTYGTGEEGQQSVGRPEPTGSNVEDTPKKEGVELGDSFEVLDLKTRAENALRDKTDIKTINDLLHWSEDELKDIEQFGQTSYDSVEESLNKYGWEVGQLQGESEEELIDTSEEEQKESPSQEIAEKIEELTPEKTSIPVAVKLWRQATGRGKNEAARVMQENGWQKGDTDTIEEGLQALINTLPIQKSQREYIYNTAQRLNEPESHVDDRAEAMFGRPLEALNYEEAEKLYAEMIKEEKNEQEEEEESVPNIDVEMEAEPSVVNTEEDDKQEEEDEGLIPSDDNFFD